MWEWERGGDEDVQRYVKLLLQFKILNFIKILPKVFKISAKFPSENCFNFDQNFQKFQLMIFTFQILPKSLPNCFQYFKIFAKISHNFHHISQIFIKICFNFIQNFLQIFLNITRLFLRFP